MMSRYKKYSEEYILEIAKKYSNKAIFKKEYPNLYRSAYRRGFLKRACSHMPNKSVLKGKDNPAFIYTDDFIIETAKKYNTRSEWRRASYGTYQAARKRSLTEQCVSHMVRPKNYNFTYTEENIRISAKKYNTRSEWAKKDHGSYCAALRYNIIDNVCSHMKKSCGISLDEIDLFNEVTKITKNVIKLRKVGISIPNKPHIKGFDIDIFIPELNKGIEFDGDYWHSVRGLRRSREHWPEEDLRDYHKIKDNFFKQKYDISILHIKECDWKNNKKKELQKVRKFLKG
jgi:hypothetical protein